MNPAWYLCEKFFPERLWYYYPHKTIFCRQTQYPRVKSELFHFSRNSCFVIKITIITHYAFTAEGNTFIVEIINYVRIGFIGAHQFRGTFYGNDVHKEFETS